jgi:hypothetical protein
MTPTHGTTYLVPNSGLTIRGWSKGIPSGPPQNRISRPVESRACNGWGKPLSDLLPKSAFRGRFRLGSASGVSVRIPRHPAVGGMGLFTRIRWLSVILNVDAAKQWWVGTLGCKPERVPQEEPILLNTSVPTIGGFLSLEKGNNGVMRILLVEDEEPNYTRRKGFSASVRWETKP